MAKALAKKPAKPPARPAPKVAAKAVVPTSRKPARPIAKTPPRNLKIVKKATTLPIAVKPPKVKTPETKVGTPGKLTADLAAIAGKNPVPKAGKTPAPAGVNGKATIIGKAAAAPVRPGVSIRVSVPPAGSVAKPTMAKAASPNKSLAIKPMPVIIPSPVPTDGKPRKNQAGLSSKELEFYRELLLGRRRELVGDMSSMEREALRSANSNPSNQPVHLEDQGTDNYEQEFTLGLVEKDRNLLREINRALGKIQDGTYGICEGTAKPIGKPRLEAQPWAKFSIEYARELEKGGVRR